MKKVKFTLGLMLSMLFLGASVSNAAYDNARRHDRTISTTLSIGASEYYTGLGVEFSQYAISHNGYYLNLGGNTNSGAISTYTTALPVKDSYTTGNIGVWQYGGNVSHPVTNNAVDYYYSDALKRYVGSGLYFLDVKDSIDVYNKFIVQLKYTNGNDLRPVIKRYITTGKWDFKDGRNQMTSTGIVLEETLIADSTWFRPNMEHNSGVATYIFHDDILSLIDGLTIFSINYEVTTNDEVGTPDFGEYQPPVFTEPTTIRYVKVDVESGLLTNLPKTYDSRHPIASHQNFVFEVKSDSKPSVSTNRERDEDGGVKVELKQAGIYKVTIARVQQSNLEVSVKSSTTESGTGGDDGETGNATLATDAVWAAGGTLYAKTATTGSLSIYSITGQLYKTESISGSYTLSMPKGIYIVQLNGKAYKVVL